MTKTNLEQYKRELGEIFYKECDNQAEMFEKIKTKCDSNIRSQHGQTYIDDILDWMAQPYKEQILDNAEKAYLSAVIKPFRNRFGSIAKYNNSSWGMDDEFIRITVRGEHGTEFIKLPWFKTNAMYQGMELGKEYTLEELGL